MQNTLYQLLFFVLGNNNLFSASSATFITYGCTLKHCSSLKPTSKTFFHLNTHHYRSTSLLPNTSLRPSLIPQLFIRLIEVSVVFFNNNTTYNFISCQYPSKNETNITLHIGIVIIQHVITKVSYQGRSS